MQLSIRTRLDYRFAHPADVLLQFEAAAIPEQTVDWAHTHVSGTDMVRVPAQDGIGERMWVRADGLLHVEYDAHVTIRRILRDAAALPGLDPRELPGETVQYLMPSRYCPADHFQSFVEAEFAGLKGGALVAAMRDWIEQSFTYTPGVSNSDTTALDSFVRRQGVCRDYAHVLITLARAAAIPARMASVYALGVEPQDFHAVAEVFLGGEWHLIDATGMATEANMAKIGVGRDAADVSFMTAYGYAAFEGQLVSVQAITS
ncbi:transglutaminase family protein [Sphingomonas sp. AOB5]|uniref:transglutaminase-like domain-containing protein n=1 Tax=Sphingomonas sp. AOB5 TaxID=3034017 RepID=UPI0023F96483|nr:transglutaminase family protein [Sphingomonas sp. AOB5]MDF7777845.1 transglutaminase family protein [Sphingomonas sp. AOB5]